MSSSDALKWLNENFNFVDSVTIIDHSGTIIAKQRFNPRYTDEENDADNQWALGKNLLEVFPGQNFRSSALLAALKSDGVIYRQQEIAWNHLGKKSVTNNLTIPIVCRGQFVGSVQLSRDVTNMGYSGRSVHRAREESSAPAATGARYTLEDIVGQSPEIQEERRLIQRIANSSSSVLVYGETGTGKELVVSSIHNASYRKDKTFMPINCAALPESILESLLFGTRRGAFTGAEDRVGLIEECSGGTIYLDEISSMPLKLQSKLLRVLDTKTVMALGASKPKEVDIRIVASVNRSPEQLMQNKERLGLAMGSASLIADLNRVKFSLNPYNINRLTLKAGQAALEDTVYFEKTRAAIVDTRTWTKQQLEARGFAVLDSRSNFLFASTQKKNGGELYRKLKEKGVLVRHFDAPRIENWLRITIGTPEQMQIFLNTLDKIMEE